MPMPGIFNRRGLQYRALLALGAVGWLAGCGGVNVQTPTLTQPSQAPIQMAGSQPLKVHLMSGELLVLQRWTEQPGDSTLAGRGIRYDQRRQPVAPFDGTIAIDSIALLETTRSKTERPFGTVLLTGYTVMAGAMTIYCLADPKSCFGSCPTFYVEGDDDRPVAEGFSASVARALEATDVDDIGSVTVVGREFHLTMRNEALETHSVRSVRLLVAPRPERGAIVRAADDSYLLAVGWAGPTSCRARDGDCLAPLAGRDGREWSSRADSTDLGAPDSLDLVFPSVSGTPALLVAARQSFVSTYVFYQSMAYAGSHAGDFLAEVERRGTAGVPGAWAMMSRLARVEVLAGPVDGPLKAAGEFGEAGPIASDQQAVPLPVALAGQPIHVRLRFTRGAWRFDRLSVAQVTSVPPPTPLVPSLVERGGVPDSVAAALILDPDRHLVTEPGDSYRLTFALPDDATRLTFFLESRGYYYEWMRPEWVREEDLGMLVLMALSPEEALRRMAPGYSRLEPQLEEMFWASRFGRR